MLVEQVFSKRFSYDEYWRLQQPQLKPHTKLRQELHIGYKKQLWKVIDEKKQNKTLELIEPGYRGQMNEMQIEQDKEVIDELFDGYVEFCRITIAEMNYPELMAIPSIRKEFEANTYKTKTKYYPSGEDDADNGETADALDSNGFFEDDNIEQTQKAFIRDQIKVQAYGLQAQFMDIKKNVPNSSQKLKVLLDINKKIRELNKLIKKASTKIHLKKAKEISSNLPQMSKQAGANIQLLSGCGKKPHMGLIKNKTNEVK